MEVWSTQFFSSFRYRYQRTFCGACSMTVMSHRSREHENKKLSKSMLLALDLPSIKCYGVIHRGSLKRERQTGEVYSQLSHMLFTNVYRN